MSLSEFIHMGGYAVFVWSSYGIALVVLVLNWVLPYQQLKQNKRKLSRQFRTSEKQVKDDNDSST
jgi:heme exporter protein D